MAHFIIDNEMIDSEHLPSFSLTIEDFHATSIYSDTDMQAELVKVLRNNGKIPVFDLQDGLYERLTVEENIIFYQKWFGCKIPIPEILVLFELQTCAKTPVYKCSESEARRVHFARYYMSGGYPMVFLEPIHGIDIRTTNTFIRMIEKIKDSSIPVLVLVSNMEHALLLGEVAYKLQEKGIQQIEVDEGEEQATTDSSAPPMTTNLFKIPVKVDDKMILFDPPEIDYIESQDGKAMIVINDQSYAMDSTLGEMEKKLGVYGFYRCHRSYIVNLQKVREIITWSKNTYSLRIDNKLQSTIPLSRTKIQDIQEKFSL
ncbi:ABC-2 type transport system ATP-binding protein [Virgibacillus natechei]|uniref:ABC-2 type transport system ATP-binding protein n=1 Tax=Virgibacillus natechei TaxID=1216297 RepID=A0ABS4IFT6_9BACI|nr:response regulator transcription factor [Virgibacillus natechei]MBP1969797.1 ABC-2 type transport system ATP-binding protein [Virgibacillus natechei]UZD12667.1 LytTR family transcriptional regulator DNA-binding domain-containing protein [Virgibacillus natechei]